jgi:hypothetical protein
LNSIISRSGSIRKLTRPMKRVLRVIIQANTNGKALNVTDLCKQARVSPKVYYRMLEDPSLGELLPECLDYLLSQQLIPVIQTIVQRALQGSAKHAELVLKISGLLTADETKILQIFGNANQEENMDDIQRRVQAFIEHSKEAK